MRLRIDRDEVCPANTKMFFNRIYYILKPVIPDSVRLFLRRGLTRQQRRTSSRSWPIQAGSERPPAGWPGWPDGKKFAFILTHDVEGPRGLERCEQLMNFEKNLGFRSSFNLIPEGEYEVPASLRKKLEENGFEVGLHDLEHNGKLFQSEKDFRRCAPRINKYLREWRVSGFRAGFMFHNLEWLCDLDVSYDASTFDTDPFEPQPDGVNTIFPFFVRSQSDPSRGYVELPYTLVQDSTLFLHLQETNIRIWKEKLDWIAANGGMALLDTHPDYMSFSDQPNSNREYAVGLYRDLLKYVSTRYAGSYWAPLPREVAQWYRSTLRTERAVAAGA
jgi:hypothetical protein